MKRLQRNSGSIVILGALAFVTILALTAGSTSYISVLKAKQTHREIARSEGFYPGEVCAFHNVELRRGNLAPLTEATQAGRFVASLDSTYASGVAASPAGCSGAGVGIPHSLGCTENFDSGRALQERLRPNGLTFLPERMLATSQQFCASLAIDDDYSVVNCLAEPRTVYDLTILDSTGRTVNVTYDSVQRTITAFTPLSTFPNAPNPRLDSAKFDGMIRRDYEFRNSPIMDAATDGQANTYYLLSDGRIIESPGSTLVHTDPKILSIAFRGTWFYLRSDGAVFVGSDNIAEMGESSIFEEIPGLRLPTARALVMGEGPANPSL